MRNLQNRTQTRTVRLRGGGALKPPTIAARRNLNISPVAQKGIEGLLGQIGARREFHQARANAAKKILELVSDMQKSLEPVAGAPNVQGVDPCTSVVETSKMYSEIQAFIFAASLETDYFRRMGHVGKVSSLLNNNEALLRLIAESPGQFGLPTPEMMQAVIVSKALADKALKANRTRWAVMSAAPANGIIKNDDMRKVQLAQRDSASATGIPMPKVEMLVQPDVRGLMAHLGYDYSACNTTGGETDDILKGGN